MAAPPPYGQAPYPQQQQYPPQQQPGVVYQQPGMVQPVQIIAAPPKPQDYMILSIVVLLCCNCLFGIIALIFSLQSDSAYKAGNIDEAASKGDTAKKINIAGIVITIILIIIIVVLYVVVFAAAVSNYDKILKANQNDGEFDWGN